MALETGTYISDLVTTNPAASDAKSQGDDHLRLLKSTLKATFPNVTGAVTVTQAEINSVTAKAPLNSPALTGTPTAPTAVTGTNTTQLATTEFVTAMAVAGAVTQAIPTCVVIASSGTWTCPVSIVKAKITIVGGGGSSGTSDTNAASGGAGGGTAIKYLTVTPGVVYTATIGAGGAVVTGSSASGNAGGTSSFSGSGISTITATGGGGGAPIANSGLGGSGSGGDISIPGGTSSPLMVNQGGYSFGGASFLSAGGSPNANGVGFGAGSGGVFSASTGKAGASGVVIIEY